MTQNGTYNLSESFTLTCEASGSPLPLMLLIRNNNQILLSSVDVHFQRKNETNDIQEFFIDDNGNSIIKNQINYKNDILRSVTYYKMNKVKIQFNHNEWHQSQENITCVALNSVGEDRKTVSIELISVPEFQKNSYHELAIDILDGFPIELKCNPNSYSTVNISWKKVI